MSHARQLAINWIEQGLVPDAVIRAGIRHLCEQRLTEIAATDCKSASQLVERFVSSMEASDVTPLPHLANEQHYEVPVKFFTLALGPIASTAVPGGRRAPKISRMHKPRRSPPPASMPSFPMDRRSSNWAAAGAL